MGAMHQMTAEAEAFLKVSVVSQISAEDKRRPLCTALRAPPFSTPDAVCARRQIEWMFRQCILKKSKSKHQVL